MLFAAIVVQTLLFAGVNFVNKVPSNQTFMVLQPFRISYIRHMIAQYGIIACFQITPERGCQRRRSAQF